MTMSYRPFTDTELQAAKTRFPFDCEAVGGARIAGAAVVLNREDKLTRQDKPMASITFGNASGRAILPVWSEQLSSIHDVKAGSNVLLTCIRAVSRDNAGEWQFASATPLPPEHPIAEESQPACPVPLAELEARTIAVMNRMSDEARAVLQIVMRTQMRWANGTIASIGAMFKIAPAAVGYHHACHRGLWWHTLQVAEGALRLADGYRETDAPSVDICAVGIGALLHDIGKLCEIDRAGAYSVAPLGRFMSHMGWGISLVSEAVARAQHADNGGAPFAPTARQQALIEHTLHIIASHHGLLEWGALVTPCSREAHIVSAADNVSAKVQPITDAIPRTGHVGDGWLHFKSGWKSSVAYVGPTLPAADNA